MSRCDASLFRDTRSLAMQSGVSSVGDKTGSFALPSMPSLPGMGKSLSLDAIIVTPPLSPPCACFQSISASNRQGKMPWRNLRRSARSVVFPALQNRAPISPLLLFLLYYTHPMQAREYSCKLWEQSQQIISAAAHPAPAATSN